MKLHQPLKGAAEALFEASGQCPVIDTHEHVPRTEADYNKAEIRFGNLFNPYVSNDLASAGMPFPREVWAAFHCIDDDWESFEPYWNAVKHGSYARPLRLALQKFYGVDDFTRENYLELVRRINEANTPGIYDRIFRQTCNIEKAIRCAGDLPEKDDPILAGNISSPSLMANSRRGIEEMARQTGAGQIKSLDELVEVGSWWMDLQVSRGAMEFKSRGMVVENPGRNSAQEVLKAMQDGQPVSEDDAVPLMAYLREFDADHAARLNVPMAFHTGVWNDFRSSRASDLIGLLQRHPDTRMDIYHLSIPHVREALMVVKNFPHAWLNLCWAHVVAPEMLVQTMKEALDLVPMNKIFAFGADYVLFIEKVYGHLLMARENIARVLGDRVDNNLMDLDEATAIQRAWFYDNPKAFYGI